MKNPRAALRVALAACVVLVLTTGCGPTEPEPTGDKIPTRIEKTSPTAAIPLAYDFVALDFVDSKNGWVVGADDEQNTSTIARTTDGGLTWTQTAEFIGDTVYDIDFVDRQFGWAVGSEGRVYRSLDGGATWLPELPTSALWTDQRRIEPERVSTAGADGNTNAAPQSDLVFGESVATIFFVDERTGWAVGDTPTGTGIEVRGLLLVTNDGGRTWSDRSSGVPFTLHDVWFLDASNGWAVGGQIDERQEDVLLRTADGGRSWTRATTGTAQIHRAVQFVDPNRGWITGMTIDAVNELPGPSKLLTTLDGGQTWRVAFDAPRSLYDVHFVDPLHGWVAGDRSALYATFDGGRTWTQQTAFDTSAVKTYQMPAQRASPDENAPKTAPLRTLFFRDATNGWVAGEGVIIKRTGDDVRR